MLIVWDLYFWFNTTKPQYFSLSLVSGSETWVCVSFSLKQCLMVMMPTPDSLQSVTQSIAGTASSSTCRHVWRRGLMSRNWSRVRTVPCRLKYSTTDASMFVFCISDVKSPRKIFPDLLFGSPDSEKVEARKSQLSAFLKVGFRILTSVFILNHMNFCIRILYIYIHVAVEQHSWDSQLWRHAGVPCHRLRRLHSFWEKTFEQVKNWQGNQMKLGRT